MKTIVTALLLFICLPLCAGASADVRKGDKLFHRKKYGQALSSYERALEHNPNNAKAAFGAGAAAYYLKDYKSAEQAFENAGAQDEKLAQDALFNLGTSYYRAQDKEQAKTAYRKLLLQNPNDKETLHNYQIILEEENQNNQQKNDQNNDKDNPQNQNNDQNQNQNNQQDNNQNQDQNQDNNQNQPEEQDTMDKDDAQRVMQMARDSEHKPKPQQQGKNSLANNNVEQDW